MSLAQKATALVILMLCFFWNSIYSNKLATYKAARRYNRTGVECKEHSSEQIGLGKVTIVFITYQRVKVLLASPVFIDLAPLGLTKQVLIIWNDVDSPESSEIVQQHFNGTDFGHKVKIIYPDKNSLNNRFTAVQSVSTEVFFSIDDDFMVTTENYIAGYEFWLRNPYRLVGFYPRVFQNSNNNFNYRWQNMGAFKDYNALLSGGGLFIHPLYVQVYSSSVPAVVKGREIVDSKFNCEDILMNFIVPKLFHPPFLVAIHNHTSKPFAFPQSGLSLKSDHMPKRISCLALFNNLFGWPFIMTKSVATHPPTDSLHRIQVGNPT